MISGYNERDHLNSNIIFKITCFLFAAANYSDTTYTRESLFVFGQFRPSVKNEAVNHRFVYKERAGSSCKSFQTFKYAIK